MLFKKKPIAWLVAGLVLLWQLFIQPVWNLNVEKLAEQSRLDTALSQGGAVIDAIWRFADYIPSSFSLGFAAGGLIFAHWDSATRLFYQHVLRSKKADPVDTQEIKAWVGDISVIIKEQTPEEALILIRVINWGTLPFRIMPISGRISLTHDDGTGRKVTTALSPPGMGDPMPRDGAMVEPGYLLYLDIRQSIPRSITRLMPDIFSWETRPYFRLADLELWLEADNGSKKRLKLPDSLRVTAGPWTIRADQTSRLFKDDAEHEQFINAFRQLGQRLSGRFNH